MNYGILRIEKIKLSDGGGLKGRALHNFRQFSNVSEKFDISLTRHNEYLISKNYNELKQRFQERLATLTRKPRSDAVGMLEVVVTTTAGALEHQDEKAFFSDALKEVQSWYGADNVLAMAIHRDETTPHCHIFIAPIETKQVKKTRYKANEQHVTVAKTSLNAFKITGGKEQLSKMQDRFHANVFSKYGLARGERVADTGITKHNTRSSLKILQTKLEEEKVRLTDKETTLEANEKLQHQALKQKEQELANKELQLKQKEQACDAVIVMADEIKEIRDKQDKLIIRADHYANQDYNPDKKCYINDTITKDKLKNKLPARRFENCYDYGVKVAKYAFNRANNYIREKVKQLKDILSAVYQTQFEYGRKLVQATDNTLKNAKPLITKKQTITQTIQPAKTQTTAVKPQTIQPTKKRKAIDFDR